MGALATLIAHQRATIAQRRRLIARAAPASTTRARLEDKLALDLAVLDQLAADQAAADLARARRSWAVRRPAEGLDAR